MKYVILCCAIMLAAATTGIAEPAEAESSPTAQALALVVEAIKDQRPRRAVIYRGRPRAADGQPCPVETAERLQDEAKAAQDDLDAIVKALKSR